MCVCTQAWPSPQLLLLEGRREVAGVGEGASSLEAGGGNAGRKPPLLRRLHPTLGILGGPPLLYTQTPGLCWGPGPQSLPVEAKAEMVAAPGPDSQPGEESRQRPGPGGGRHPGTRWVGSQPLIKGPEPLAGDAGDRPPRPQ